jgi:hypothetical protein
MSQDPSRSMVIGLVAALCVWQPATAQKPQRPSGAAASGYAISAWRDSAIDHHNQVLLMRAALHGQSEGIVLFATAMGETPRTVTELVALGAEVQQRFDEIGYVRARIALRDFPRAQNAPGVLMALIDGAAATYLDIFPRVRYPFSAPMSGAEQLRADSVARQRAAKENAEVAALPLIPDAARAPNSPYFAFDEMRMSDFRRIDPRFDGRGVTIAVLESGTFDFTHPALLHAYDVNGKQIPKLRGVLNPISYDPDIPNPQAIVGAGQAESYANFDLERVRRLRTVTAAGGVFTVDGTKYNAPDGTYSFGMYRRRGTNHAVIWDELAKRVWVDTNRDEYFTDEHALQDIDQRFNVGQFRSGGRTVSFAVHFDSIPGNIRIHEGSGSHQTMTASMAAGAGILGAGNAAGSGAQVLIVDAGRKLHSFLESWIRAAKDPRVDLITASQVSSVTIHSGESLFGLMMNRIVEVYGKPLFNAAGNTGPGTTTPGEPSTARRVISVGGYVSPTTYKTHYGWDLPEADNVIPYSARGPATNGGAKPDFLAPTLGVAATPCSAFGVERTTVYRLPECYQLAGGTSSATPHAAGAAAAIIGAAKLNGLPHDARHIEWALRTGARYLPNLPAHEQGAGLIDMVRSYELLKIAKETSLVLPDIESRAAVNTRIAKLLREPGVGDGLYEREGWTVRDTGSRVIRLMRRTGPASPTTYTIALRGNDGTFSLPTQSVVLPLNEPIDVKVALAPRTTGMHSAHLLVKDSAADLAVHTVLLTVVAAERFTRANDYTVRFQETTPWPRAKSLFIDVPEGTASLRFDLKIKAGRLKLITNDGSIDRSGFPRGYRFFRYHEPLGFIYPGTRTMLVADPEPGVMEITLDPQVWWEKDSLQYHVPSDFELTVSVQKVEGHIASADGQRNMITFDNAQASIGDPRVKTEVGAQRVLRGAASTAAIVPTTYFINVDSGTTTLRVNVRAENPADELALYLYDCADDKCGLWDFVMRKGPAQSLMVVKPRAGQWKVVVQANRAKRDSAAFTYSEVLTNPMYGSGDSSLRVTRASLDTVRPRLITRPTFTATGAPRTGYEWVGVTDLFDADAEQTERRRPLGLFRDYLPAYRPVRLATVIVPLTIRNGEH